MTPEPKRPRPFGRLPQCNKRFRLVRRHLGQWQPQPKQVRGHENVRYALEEALWKEGV